MSSPIPITFPLVELQPISNMNRDWVAVAVRTADDADLVPIFATDLLAAIAPLDCVTFRHDIHSKFLPVLPPEKVLWVIPAAQAGGEGGRALRSTLDAGFRLLLDGSTPEGVNPPPAIRARAFDASGGAGQIRVAPVFGPHLAYGVDSIEQLERCADAGFSWFAGAFALHPRPSEETKDDGTTRRRLLSLLGLLARDADSRDIETVLKQDPALSYHLLKLVNSAAFSVGAPIHSFGQAINVLGRRQLQRWLQLLLYARQETSGPNNALLPLAALRGAQMEALCKRGGGERDAQDLAFMVGVFSLLDLLLHMTMEEIVDSLSLPAAAAGALRARQGPLGGMLALTERQPTHAQLAEQGISTEAFWESQLNAYRWAIQVSRNL